MRDEFGNEESTDEALVQLGDKVEELIATATDDPALVDDDKAKVIQMLEEVQQYIDDARKITAASAEDE